MKSVVERCLKDPAFRVQATRQNHALFFLVYFSRHLEYALAPFHKIILKWTNKRQFKFIVVAAFRGSGKSTICTLSLPLWMILGKPQKKFVLIVARTQEQARMLLANIIKEVEGNDLLKRDLGPLQYEKDELRRFSLEFGKYGAKIMAASLEQSIRGIKYGSHRPDCIICDDLEDSDAVKTQEGRDAIHLRFSGEILTVGDSRTDYVVVGNTVHEDGLILRLGGQILASERTGFFGRFPIVENGKPTWPGKFKNMEAVEEERRKIGNEAIWRREQLLDPRTDVDSIVKEEWIRTWHKLPDDALHQRHVRVIGVDLAFSTGPTADYTAIVPAEVFWTKEGFEIYILPEIQNKRLEPLRAKEAVMTMAQVMSVGKQHAVKIFMEDMGAQRLYVEEWKREGYNAETVPLRSMPKEERLAFTAQFIQKGCIFFPPRGAEFLKRQIVDFGLERSDDLMDAFTILVIGVVGMARPSLLSLSDLAEVNRKLQKSYIYEQERKKPDHSGDRDRFGGSNILTMRF